MEVLIVGGGGFLGQKLAEALGRDGTLAGAAIESLTLADIAPAPLPEAPFPARSVTVDIREAEAVADLTSSGPDVIFHLAAVVSGQAEAEFDLGLAINLDGTRNVLEAARGLGTRPMVVFTSSIAVYGGDLPDPIPEHAHLTPQTSYGAQKAAGELLVSDYSRKGFVDGRSLRLPTISIRPGKPNKAASSFMSSIFREPLQGQEAVCPVEPGCTHFFMSPRTCVANLVHAARVPAEDFGQHRSVLLPGQTYSIHAMIEAMDRVAGDSPSQRIRWERDSAVEAIVLGWKARFDTARGQRLGFVSDSGFEAHVRAFLEEDIAT